MTAYFDQLRRDISALSNHDLDDEAWLENVSAIEKGVIQQVCLVTGDREFPDDLRERLLGAIAVHAVATHGIKPLPKAIDRALVTRSSPLCEDLHRLFHELAQRRITTRFGLMFDSPEGILKCRDEYDREQAQS